MSDPTTRATAAGIPYEGTDCTPEEAVEAVKAVRATAATFCNTWPFPNSDLDMVGPDDNAAVHRARGEPRYATTDDGRLYCEDCGVAVIERKAHTRFHSILSSHAWTLAVLQNTHLAAHLHDKYDAVERIKRRTFDNWSADALAEVMAEREASDGT